MGICGTYALPEGAVARPRELLRKVAVDGACCSCCPVIYGPGCGLHVHQSGFGPHRARNAETACDSPAVDSFMTRAASAAPGSVISILSRAATASRNSKDEGVAQLMNEAPGSTASSLTTDPNRESVATRSPAASFIAVPVPGSSDPALRK